MHRLRNIIKMVVGTLLKYACTKCPYLAKLNFASCAK